jgi:hypothetical protein
MTAKKGNRSRRLMHHRTLRESAVPLGRNLAPDKSEDDKADPGKEWCIGRVSLYAAPRRNTDREDYRFPRIERYADRKVVLLS